ncbi:MAG TPA: helix-turn-helix domain-containing protein [Candidatus Binataceae bacterium]|nr:helix-turn-helix domain-containing protein [Candidatus Binataceae bacterium]
MATISRRKGSAPQDKQPVVIDRDTEIITMAELAAYLNCHEATIRRLLQKGEIPGFKLGSDWRFNLRSIEEWRKKRMTNKAAKP